jgi:soluble lytic murein transglycosylase-like protein
MQLMPGTADAMDVEDPFDAKDTLHGGTRYLSLMLERFNKDMRLALAAYNAGPERVAEYRGVPPYQETRTFIDRVLSYYRQFDSGSK